MSYSSEVLADSPLGYWRLGDSSGTTMADSSGNARHGSYAGSPTLGVASLLVGDANTAVDFPGGLQWGTTPSVTAFNVSTLTAECWFNADTVSGDRPLVTRTDWAASNSDLSRSWHLIVQGGTLKAQVVTTTGANLEIAGGSLSTGTTYHAAFTFDGSTIRLYLNGSQVGSGSLSGAPSANNRDVEIGTDTGRRYARFDGRIDEVAVYGSALSGARLAAHYLAGTGGGAVLGSAVLVGNSTMSASGKTLIRGGAALVGNGNLAASGVVPGVAPVYGSASLVGEGLLVASDGTDFEPFVPPRLGYGIRFGSSNVNSVKVSSVPPEELARLVPLGREAVSTVEV